MASKESSLLDKYGIGVSITCAVHCTILPVLISFAPLVGFKMFTGKVVEFSLICLSIIIACCSLLKSYQNHRNLLPIMIAVIGLGCIIIGYQLPSV
ncbi:MerC domain-containing protein [Mucilaginibacter sp.]